MVQAAVLDGLVFDAPPFGQDGFAATEVDVSRGEVADALVVAVVVAASTKREVSGIRSHQKLSLVCDNSIARIGWSSSTEVVHYLG